MLQLLLQLELLLQPDVHLAVLHSFHQELLALVEGVPEGVELRAQGHHLVELLVDAHGAARLGRRRDLRRNLPLDLGLALLLLLGLLALPPRCLLARLLLLGVHAELLQVALHVVHRHPRHGHLPQYRLGGRLLRSPQGLHGAHEVRVEVRRPPQPLLGTPQVLSPRVLLRGGARRHARWVVPRAREALLGLDRVLVPRQVVPRRRLQLDLVLVQRVPALRVVEVAGLRRCLPRRVALQRRRDPQAGQLVRVQGALAAVQRRRVGAVVRLPPNAELSLLLGRRRAQEVVPVPQVVKAELRLVPKVRARQAVARGVPHEPLVPPRERRRLLGAQKPPGLAVLGLLPVETPTPAPSFAVHGSLPLLNRIEQVLSRKAKSSCYSTPSESGRPPGITPNKERMNLTPTTPMPQNLNDPKPNHRETTTRSKDKVSLSPSLSLFSVNDVKRPEESRKTRPNDGKMKLIG
mmetsp:Transcript_2436/g.5694  ORF Transcript_2436/g.5694 Transcript_2436/m.5694 type:complete len:463 (-) Transcript_2436:11-1399(-)